MAKVTQIRFGRTSGALHRASCLQSWTTFVHCQIASRFYCVTHKTITSVNRLLHGPSCTIRIAPALYFFSYLKTKHASVWKKRREETHRSISIKSQWHNHALLLHFTLSLALSLMIQQLLSLHQCRSPTNAHASVQRQISTPWNVQAPSKSFSWLRTMLASIASRSIQLLSRMSTY